MSIKHVAAAVITPAAIAGIALSAGTAANAATAHHATHRQHHQWVTVRAGDTLSGIAAAHHMSWEALYTTPPNHSRIHDPNLLTVGEGLRIPADPAMWAARFVAPTPAAQPAQDPAQSAPDQQPAAQASPQSGSASGSRASTSSAGQSSSAGESSFEQCVSWRESGNNASDPDGLFGILPSTWASLGHSGSAGQASVSEQKAAFNQLYAEDGTQPWAPSDGC